MPFGNGFPRTRCLALSFQRPGGLTAFLYQRHRETIAFERPDLAVSGTGSSSAAPAADSQGKSAA